MPFATFVTLAVQAEAPVAHEVCPFWHAFGWQAVPAVHDTHEPLLQTRLVPQLVPSARFETLAVHCEVPVAHEVLPVVQTDGLHVALAVHELHEPLLQTWLVPQLVPLATLLAGVQTMVPVEHE